MKEVWTDISFCLDFKNKRMDAWVDGIKKVEILKSPIFFKPKEIYFKHGIYRSFISSTKHRIMAKCQPKLFIMMKSGGAIQLKKWMLI